jgi:hypothetical protein
LNYRLHVPLLHPFPFDFPELNDALVKATFASLVSGSSLLSWMTAAGLGLLKFGGSFRSAVLCSQGGAGVTSQPVPPRRSPVARLSFRPLTVTALYDLPGGPGRAAHSLDLEDVQFRPSRLARTISSRLPRVF